MKEMFAQIAALTTQIRLPAGEAPRQRPAEIALPHDKAGHHHPTLRHKLAPVKIGRFDGENPAAWIFQVERYFDFYHIVDDEKLTIALFYLDGEARDWYRWFHWNW